MKFQRRAREDIDLNLMPLIDVIFLLLIFFMVTTTFTKDSRLGMSLPKSEIGQQVTKRQHVEVIIDADGVYKVNDKPLIDNNIASLKIALSEVLDKALESADNNKVSEKSEIIPSLTITADAQTAHQYVVTAMDVAGQLGFSKLSITTLKEE
jgi:biopolymer transport protein ExbD